MQIISSTRFPLACGSLLLLLIAGACRAPQETRSTQTPLELPEKWIAGASASSASGPVAGWWRSFDDPGLNALVERVLQGNLDLRATAARLQGAQAQARLAGAALWPTINANGDAGRQRQNFVGFPIPGATEQVLSTTTSNFGVSLTVSWELDLWGKLNARQRAASAVYRASEADYAAAQLSLAGQAAKSWFALTEAKLQRENAAQTVQTYGQSTSVLRERFAQRGMTGPDLRLAESQLATARAVLAGYEESIARVARQIEFLAGAYPSGELEGDAAFPSLPQALPAVLPGELLQRRPDLIAAEERLKGADLQLYAARKDLYPSISLSTSAGRRSASASNLTSNDFEVWSLVSNISAPLFQGGRLRAMVDFEKSNVQAALQDWASSLLQAVLEVETALATEAPLTRREKNLGLAAEHAAAARELAEQRYLLGRNDIIAVLDARQRAFANRSTQLSAQRVLLDLRVDLFLALGGGYGENLPTPSANESAPNPAR